jgi:hypothetical protein
MSARAITLALGTAGAFLAAGLIPLATSPVAHAVCMDDQLGCDPGFLHATDPLLQMFGITEIGVSDSDDNFEGMILNIPSLGITDVLTSGKDTSDLLAGQGITIPDSTGVGEAGVTVNTFVDTMMPSLDSQFTIPFTDPLAALWDILVANNFFGL